MKRKQKLENKKGITLIALIITIIVLLILAGVSIAMLAGENGILNRAGEASETTKESNAREKVELAVMETLTEKNGVFDTDVFENEVKKAGGEIIDQTEDEIVVEMNGYEVTVDAKTGEIKDVEKAGGVKAKFETKLYTKGGREPSADGQEELVLTVDVTNKENIGEGEIKVTVTAPNGDNIEANAEVTGEGYKSFKVDQNGEYTVTVETTVDGITKKVTKKVTVNSIIIPEFSREYGTIDIRFINGIGDTATASQTANKPVLGENMKAVNFNEETNSWTELNGTEGWDYSYTNEAGQSKWANAVVEDENGQITGYFVWIPRYAYKITYHSGSLEGEVVGYSDSRGMVRKDGNLERVYTGEDSNRRNAGDNFIVHPAFTNDVNVGGWGEEVAGIWVAKYEASGSTTSVKVLPGKSSLRSPSVGSMYTAAENYNTEINSHLMKNSEWGAIAYLSYSNYGIGINKKIESNVDSNYVTGGSEEIKAIYTENVGQTTTGNVYGLYDMVGGSYEYVASYSNTGGNVRYGNEFATNVKEDAKSSNKVTVYDEGYYLCGEKKFGDAIFEMSYRFENRWEKSWDGSLSGYPSEDSPFFYRGTRYKDTTGGILRFSGNRGYNSDPSYPAKSMLSFRPVLIP